MFHLNEWIWHKSLVVRIFFLLFFFFFQYYSLPIPFSRIDNLISVTKIFRHLIWLTWKVLSWPTLQYFVIHLLPGPSHMIKLTVPVTCIYLYTYLVSKGVTYFFWTPVNVLSTSSTTFYNQAGTPPPLDDSTNLLSFNFLYQIQLSKYLYEDTYVFLFFFVKLSTHFKMKSFEAMKDNLFLKGRFTEICGVITLQG